MNIRRMIRPGRCLTFSVLLGLTAGSLLVVPASHAEEKATLNYKTHWVGNTFGGGSKWVQNFADSMCVLPDGTAVVGSFWDEAGREVGLYRNGDVIGQLAHTHMRAGFVVAANSRHLFYAHTCALDNQPQAKAGEAQQQKPICYFGVSRYTHDGQPAPFTQGKTGFRNMYIMREELDNHSLIPRGLAATEDRLLIADTAFDAIEVVDLKTFEKVGRFDVPHPQSLAMRADDVWVICGKPTRVARYRIDGTLQLEALNLPNDAIPSGLGFDRAGHLMVCDNGPSQQIHLYDVSTGQPSYRESLGTKGGMFAGPKPGTADAWRLAGPTGAGCDADGNLYISCNVPRRGTVLRSFTPERKLRWELLGLEFVDVADVDPASDGRDIYSADDRYEFDPAGEAGKNWTWVGHTLDPHRYPHDLRLHFAALQCGTQLRTIGNQRFLCLRGMWQGILGIYRLDGNLAVPSVVMSSGPLKSDEGWSPPGQPAEGRWIWRDMNGNGQMESGEYVLTKGPDGEFWASNVDSRGDLWQGGRESGIWHWKCLGLDDHGNPRYDETPQHVAMPKPFHDLLRTEYLPETDTMYLSGQTKDRPITNGEWGTAGTVIVRYDNWSQSPKQRYRIDLPYVGDKTFIVSIAYAGDLAFAVDCKSAEVLVYDLRDGHLVGSMKPGPEVHRESGWVDFRDAIRAFKRTDGSYLVIAEEDFKGKSLIYHLRP